MAAPLKIIKIAIVGDDFVGMVQWNENLTDYFSDKNYFENQLVFNGFEICPLR